MSYHPSPRELHQAHEDARNEAALLRRSARLVEQGERNERRRIVARLREMAGAADGVAAGALRVAADVLAAEGAVES